MKIQISTHVKTLLSREPLHWLLIITNGLNVCLCVSHSSRQSTEQNGSTANNHHPSKTIPLAALLAIIPQNMRSSLGLGTLPDTMGVGCSKALVLFQDWSKKSYECFYQHTEMEILEQISFTLLVNILMCW